MRQVQWFEQTSVVTAQRAHATVWPTYTQTAALVGVGPMSRPALQQSTSSPQFGQPCQLCQQNQSRVAA